MERFKINVSTGNASEIIDMLVFMGCRLLATKEQLLNEIGRGGTKLCESGRGIFTSKTEYNSLKEITLPELRDMVVLKRNSIDDASFKDTFGDIWYVDSTNSYWMFENGIWREADKPLFKLEPIEKLVDKEVKMKEFLNPEQGHSLVKCFVGETSIPESWIEIPEGAEILYFDKRYEPSNHFFKTVNGKSYYKYLKNGSKWMEYSDEGLNEFKENIDNFRIMWQRSPTTPDTSTQDKLKFIEKWLNGEKIQYILGIESEKTQWHNFTEGAMQYIKRSDIKFREAPKYITINGIEFKSVESILNYINSNFDLEDGE